MRKRLENFLSQKFPDPTCSGSLLVVGSARCVWDDIAKANHAGDVMCVNDVIMHYPYKFQHAYSNDWDMLPKWLAARRPRYRKEVDGHIRAHCCHRGAGEHWNVPGQGTSPLSAVYVGIALGYEEIMLAGVPLDNSGHYFDPPNVKTNFENEVPKQNDSLRFWTLPNERVFKGKVKSMSGRTKELLSPSSF